MNKKSTLIGLRTVFGGHLFISIGIGISTWGSKSSHIDKHGDARSQGTGLCPNA